MGESVLDQARALLETLTPLRHDCGQLCGAACCAPDEDGQGGVYLFPGEEARYDSVDWARIEVDAFGPMLVCDGHCPRENRPLGCRIFPLTPVRKRAGWDVRLDRRAWALCPLMPHGVRGLDPDFVAAARAAVRLIAQDEPGERFLYRWQELEESFAQATL